jgi:RimJ/RimL family protein N-acetyltransferase
VICELAASDTAETLLLLGARPLHNVFLEYVVRAGALGRMSGFMGYRSGNRLEAVIMIGPNGETALEVRNRDAFVPLAEAAHGSPVQPRHIVGAEETTTPFWQHYSVFGATPRWERREPFYVVTEPDLRRAHRGDATRMVAATEADLDEIVVNSGMQHREDLKDDPLGDDPEAFRRRHLRDIREQRWWTLRDRGRIAFQVHVGPENAHAVQVGGVMTPPDLRGRGYASRGLTAIADQLLRHRPAVTLFCDEGNVAACGLYQKVGFQRLFYYRSWLLETRVTSSGCDLPEPPG